MTLLARIEAARIAEMKALAVTYNTQYLVECGDEILLATDSLTAAAEEIENIGSGIKCVAVLMSRNGDTFEVIESFLDGKPHRPAPVDEEALVKLLNK